jgi:hypothetical protein
MKMSDATPYSTRPEGERAREAQCFRDILSGAVRPELVLETFGGIGDTTAVLEELWPGVSTVATELDPSTAEMYRARHDATGHPVFNHDALAFDWAGAIPDSVSTLGIVLDYNLLTLKRLREEGSFVRRILEAVPVERANWITVTDAAIGKFHLNKASYGATDWEEYIWMLHTELEGLLNARGGNWNLAAVSKHSRAASLRMDRRD